MAQLVRAIRNTLVLCSFIPLAGCMVELGLGDFRFNNEPVGVQEDPPIGLTT